MDEELNALGKRIRKQLEECNKGIVEKMTAEEMTLCFTRDEGSPHTWEMDVFLHLQRIHIKEKYELLAKRS